MNLNDFKSGLILFGLLLGIVNVNATFLLFPASSVLQITASLALPIDLPGRKLYLDYGYQFNFNLPFDPASFYNLSIWPTQSSRKRDKRNLYAERNANLSKYDNYRSGHGLYHPHDFTAGELYESMENMLMRYGFHETCLLRTVCELARHPFADGHQNILTETLTFVLTPSLHTAFADTEQIYREVYEKAEEHGFFGGDCSEIYSECNVDLLKSLTKILY